MSKKRLYKKGMELFHNKTKQKILFGKWNEDGSGACMTKDLEFLTVEREVLDTDYTAYSEIEKQAKERRRGQGWK